MNRFLIVIAVLLSSLQLKTSDCFGIDPGIVPDAADTRFDAVFQLIKVYTDPSHTQYFDHLDNYNSVSGSGTLISPHLVLMADHSLGQLQPGQNHAPFARFRRRPDGTIPANCNPPSDYHHVKIVDWIQLNGTDMVIGKLETPVTHIQPIPVRYILPTNPKIADEAQRPDVYIAGWGKYDDSPHPQGNCMHKLRYARAALAPITNYNTNEFSVVKLSLIPIPGVPEPAHGTLHDSGGPILLDDPVKGLQVLGTFHYSTGGPAVWGAFYSDPGALAAANQLPPDTSPTAGTDWPDWTNPAYPRYLETVNGGGDRLLVADPPMTVWDPKCLADLDEDGILEQSDRDAFVDWMLENVPRYVPGNPYGAFTVSCCDDETCDLPAYCFGDVNGDGFANIFDELIMNTALFSDVVPRSCFCYGDANLDRSIDFFDINVVLTYYGTTDTGYAYIAIPGDVNFDGVTDFTDLKIVTTQLNAGCTW